MAHAGVDRHLEYLRRAPKVELHVHLEGGLKRERLYAILQRHRLHPEVRGPEDLDFLYQHADFSAFLDHFRFAVTSLRDVQDVHDMAFDLFRDLAALNVVYAEVIFSAAIFTRAGMPLAELLAAVTEAEVAARRGAPTPARYNLVIDLVRNFGPESALGLVEELARVGHSRVVGVHLGGDEVRFPARLFAAAFAAAAQAGLGRAAHAGEADGAQSVWDAIEILGAQRVGHGVRSIEDARLLHELARRRITLEVCPTSNVCTGVVESWAVHPLAELLRHAVPVSLGADDPAFFDTDAVRELHRAHTQLGLDLSTLDGCVDAGLEAAFIPAEERAVRLAALREERAALRRELGLSAPAPRSA